MLYYYQILSDNTAEEYKINGIGKYVNNNMDYLEPHPK